MVRSAGGGAGLPERGCLERGFIAAFFEAAVHTCAVPRLSEASECTRSRPMLWPCKATGSSRLRMKTLYLALIEVVT